MSLIVLEGLDGSGKGTQTKLLAESLEGRGVPLRHVTFPDYDSPSSALVRVPTGKSLVPVPATPAAAVSLAVIYPHIR